MSKLVFPVALEKTCGPSQSLVFLGIQINTSTGTLALPPDKLFRLQNILKSWQDRKAVKKQKLLSLLGVLSHAATVIPPGRIFVWHLIDTSSLARAPHHFIHLQQTMPSRHALMAGVWVSMEWYILAAPTRPINPLSFRCIRELGLCSTIFHS